MLLKASGLVVTNKKPLVHLVNLTKTNR